MCGTAHQRRQQRAEAPRASHVRNCSHCWSGSAFALDTRTPSTYSSPTRWPRSLPTKPDTIVYASHTQAEEPSVRVHECTEATTRSRRTKPRRTAAGSSPSGTPTPGQPTEVLDTPTSLRSTGGPFEATVPRADPHPGELVVTTRRKELVAQAPGRPDAQIGQLGRPHRTRRSTTDRPHRHTTTGRGARRAADRSSSKLPGPDAEPPATGPTWSSFVLHRRSPAPDSIIRPVADGPAVRSGITASAPCTSGAHPRQRLPRHGASNRRPDQELENASRAAAKTHRRTSFAARPNLSSRRGDAGQSR